MTTRLDHLTLATVCADVLAALGAPPAARPEPYDAVTDSYRLLSFLIEHAVSLRNLIGEQLPEEDRYLTPTIALLEARLHNERVAAEQAYTERAEVLAFLAAALPSAMSASDEQDPDRPVLMVHGPTGQMSWHIKGADLHLFQHVRKVLPSDERTRWDGHTTEQKYQRLRELVALWAAHPPAAQPLDQAV